MRAFRDVEDQIDLMGEEPFREVFVGFDEMNLVATGAQRVGNRVDGFGGVEFRAKINRQGLGRLPRTFEIVCQRDRMADGSDASCFDFIPRPATAAFGSELAQPAFATGDVAGRGIR